MKKDVFFVECSKKDQRLFVVEVDKMIQLNQDNILDGIDNDYVPIGGPFTYDEAFDFVGTNWKKYEKVW